MTEEPRSMTFDEQNWKLRYEELLSAVIANRFAKVTTVPSQLVTWDKSGRVQSRHMEGRKPINFEHAGDMDGPSNPETGIRD